MMLYDVIAVDFIAELCVFQLNAKLKPSYIPRCGIFNVQLDICCCYKYFVKIPLHESVTGHLRTV